MAVAIASVTPAAAQSAARGLGGMWSDPTTITPYEDCEIPKEFKRGVTPALRRPVR